MKTLEDMPFEETSFAEYSHEKIPSKGDYTDPKHHYALDSIQALKEMWKNYNELLLFLLLNTTK